MVAAAMAWTSVAILSSVLSLTEASFRSCVSGDFDASKDYFAGQKITLTDGLQLSVEMPEDEKTDGSTLSVKVAQDFSIEYFNSYKVLKNLRTSQTYVLVHCGAPTPPASVSDGATVIEVPAHKLHVSDTTILNFVEQLPGGLAAIEYADLTYSSSQCVQALLAAGDIVQREADPTCDPSWCTPGDQATYDAQIAAADVVMHSSALGTSKDVAFTATADPSPLARAEWIKFVGALLNQDTAASARFEETVALYRSFKVMADEASMSSSSAFGGNKPVIAWFSYTLYGGDDGNTPEYKLSVAEYKKKFVEDVGGENFDFSGLTIKTNAWTGDPSHAGWASAADFAAAAKGVNVLIDETYTSSHKEYTLETFLDSTGLQAFASGGDAPAFLTAGGKVLRIDGRLAKNGGADDWFESAVPNPGAVLGDLARAIYGAEALGCTDGASMPRLWFRSLDAGELPTYLDEADDGAEACADPAAPAGLMIAQCSKDASKAARPISPRAAVFLVVIPLLHLFAASAL